jgi:UDP-GlcNAc:undecaprenyl-phosphate GlcNAc-1-phosphate transferase
LWVSAIGAFAVTVGAVSGLRHVAYAVDLLDRPGGHKTHHGTVPIVGGLGMLLGIIFGLASHAGGMGDLQQYIFSAILLAVVGLLDDRFNLKPSIRLVAQFVAVLPMFFGAGVRLTSFGNLFGSGPLDVSGVALISTALVTMGAINAFNMLDGLDGLAGGVTLVATLLMMTQAASGFHSGSAVLLFTLAGSITGFLLFNIPVQWNRAVRCFMGDAGSTLLGFSLAWLMIEMSQGPGRAAAPVTMVWLVAIPATDLVWTVLRRLSRGRSPIRPDNEHMHHMLLRAGLGIRAVFVVMLSLAVLCGAIGLTLEHLGTPEWLSFALLIVAGVLLVVLGLKASIVRSVVPARFHRRHVA